MGKIKKKKKQLGLDFFFNIVGLIEDLAKELYTAQGKCPKILYTKVFDEMTYANSLDPDQTGSV